MSLIFVRLVTVHTISLKFLGKGSIKKKGHKKWKKSKRGAGFSAKNQKVHNSKYGLFDKRGGGVWIFGFVQNVITSLELLHLKYFTRTTSVGLFH